MPVAVITDSTAHLPEGFADRHSIRVVPLHVLIDGVSALDCLDVGPEALAEALGQRKIVTTSRPTPGEFVAVFRAALAEGADSVVSIHLSRELSGTWEAAVLAAQEVGPDVVRIVDSRTTAMGLGFAALHAAAVAAGEARLRQSRTRRCRRRNARRRCSSWKPWNTCVAAAGSDLPRPCWGRHSR